MKERTKGNFTKQTLAFHSEPKVRKGRGMERNPEQHPNHPFLPIPPSKQPSCCSKLLIPPNQHPKDSTIHTPFLSYLLTPSKWTVSDDAETSA